MTDPNQAILITLDEPQSATNVEIAIFEADSWEADGTDVREGSRRARNDLIATFRGNIVDGKFQGTLTPQTRIPASAPSVKVRFDGTPTEHTLRVAPQRGEDERGVLEIVARASGRIGGRRREYTTPTPVFFRTFGTRRPTLAYISANDSFHQIARRFWRSRSDGLFDEGRIENILNFVRSAPEERGYGTWGVVNIVSHGNDWDWFVRLFAGRGANPYPIKKSDLDSHGGDARLLPRPTSAQLDAQSMVVLRGCVLGNNQPLIDAIRELFGSDVILYAPKYLQYYEFRGATTREGFWEQLIAYVKERSIPNAARTRELLARANPSVPDAELRQLLGDRQASHHRVERMGPMTFRYRGIRPSRDDAERDIQGLFDDLDEDRRFGTSFDEWVWDIQIRGRGNAHVATGNGSRVRLEVRRPLRESSGALVVPDLTNRNHYGRSPAW